MGLRINTNVLSLVAQRNLGVTSKALGKALERLASGSRINRAGDDAAGLAISEGLNSSTRGIKVAIRNANDALGFLNTAEGALGELTNITQRLRELGIQSANGTLGTEARGYLNSEKDALIAEFDRIAKQTEFNGVNLLDGSFATTDLQVGVSKGQSISFTIGDARASALGALATTSNAYQNSFTSAVSGVILNGIAISDSAAADDTVSSSGNAYSSISVAAAINAKAAQSRVYADVQDTVVSLNNLTLSVVTSDLAAGDFQINGVDITGDVSSVSKFLDAVNAKSNSTGIVATLASGSTDDVVLTADDGRNIQLELAAGQQTAAGLGGAFNDAANFGTFSTGNTVFLTTTALTTGVAVDITRSGRVKIRSSDDITVTGAAIGSISTGSITVDLNTAVNSIDLSSQSGAQDALSVLDSTLSSLNGLRADLGAVQSRVESTVSNLSITLENLSSARSQIRDTDVAAETAELTRAQILQQAGIAVLGQANASSQSALALLRF